MYTELVDVSIWNGNMDWDVCAKKVRGAYIRAGSISVSGVLYTDDQFNRNSQTAPQLLPVGFYWYFRPNYDPVKQADYFCQLIGKIPWKLKPALDLETAGGQAANLVADRAKRFLDRVKALLAAECIVYTRGSFWNPYVGNPPWAADYDLWCARYAPFLTGPWADGLYRPLPWKDWVLWQWSADGNFKGREYGASSHHIDLNYFNGDLGAFEAWAGGGDSPPTPPAPIPAPSHKLQMWVVQDGLRVRTGPGTNFAQLGSLKEGEIVEVLDIGGTGAWVEIKPGEWANVQLGDDRNMEMWNDSRMPQV